MRKGGPPQKTGRGRPKYVGPHETRRRWGVVERQLNADSTWSGKRKAKNALPELKEIGKEVWDAYDVAPGEVPNLGVVSSESTLYKVYDALDDKQKQRACVLMTTMLWLNDEKPEIEVPIYPTLEDMQWYLHTLAHKMGWEILMYVRDHMTYRGYVVFKPNRRRARACKYAVLVQHKGDYHLAPLLEDVQSKVALRAIPWLTNEEMGQLPATDSVSADEATSSCYVDARRDGMESIHGTDAHSASERNVEAPCATDGESSHSEERQLPSFLDKMITIDVERTDSASSIESVIFMDEIREREQDYDLSEGRMFASPEEDDEDWVLVVVDLDNMEYDGWVRLYDPNGERDHDLSIVALPEDDEFWELVMDDDAWDFVDSDDDLQPPGGPHCHTAFPQSYLPAYVQYARTYIHGRTLIGCLTPGFLCINLGNSAGGIFCETAGEEVTIREELTRTEVVTAFRVGDIFKYGSRVYETVCYGRGLLRIIEVAPLIRQSGWRRLVDHITLSGYRTGLMHRPALDATPIPAKARQQAAALAVIASTPDPVRTAVAQTVARNVAEVDKNAPFPVQGAHSTMEFAAIVAASDRTLPVQRGVGALKARCIDCGRKFVKKYKRDRDGRCGDCGETKAGRLVKAGRMVASDNNPIVYPGVVKRKTDVKPIKDSSKTFATANVYQVNGATPDELRTRLESEDRKKVASTLWGVAINGCYPYCTTPSGWALHLAITYRIFREIDRDQPDPRVFSKAHDLSDELFGSFLNRRNAPMTMDEWFATLKGRRKKILMKAHEKRILRGYDHPKYGIIGAFVKWEHLNDFAQCVDSFIPGWDVRTVPRLIQPPHDETHLDAGPYLKPLIQRLKAAWHVNNMIFYGSTAPEVLDQWLNKIAVMRSFFWADFSAFDATFTALVWRFIESLYERIYDGKPEALWKALNVWRQPIGKAWSRKDDVAFTWKSPVCNASGRDDTALANAILNGTVLSLSICAAINSVEVEDLTPAMISSMRSTTRISVVGDDSLVGFDFDIHPYADAIERNIRRFGLSVKAQHSTELMDVTYLAMFPLPVKGEGWFWAPTIGRRLYKAFWKKEEDGNGPAWCRGVAQQLALCRHVPILYEMAIQVDELLVGGKITREVVDEYRTWAARIEQTPHYDATTVNALCKRYSVTTAQVFEDIRRIKSIKSLPAVAHLVVPMKACMLDDL
jgi:DNA-directed RNA polymerase subunit RPC12/RpoP